MSRPIRLLIVTPTHAQDHNFLAFNFVLHDQIKYCGLDIDIQHHSYLQDQLAFGSELAEARALACFRLFKPDIVLVSQFWDPIDLPISIAQAMRDAGAALIYQMWDTPFFLPDQIYDIINTYHYIANFDNISMIYIYKQLAKIMGAETEFGCTAGLMCFDQAPSPVHAKETDILFVGTTYGALRTAALTRAAATAQRRGAVFRRVGGLVAGPADQGWIDWTPYFTEISRARLGLSAGSAPKMNQVRGKTFEYLHGGALPLVERHFDTELFFADDVIPLYRDPDELESQMDRLLDDPDETERRRRRAVDWWGEMNDWRPYWRALLSTLAGFGDGFHRRPALAPFEERFNAARRAAAAGFGGYVDACAQLADHTPAHVQFYAFDGLTRSALTPPAGASAPCDHALFDQGRAILGLGGYFFSN